MFDIPAIEAPVTVLSPRWFWIKNPSAFAASLPGLWLSASINHHKPFWGHISHLHAANMQDWGFFVEALHWLLNELFLFFHEIASLAIWTQSYHHLLSQVFPKSLHFIYHTLEHTTFISLKVTQPKVQTVGGQTWLKKYNWCCHCLFHF